MLGDPVEELRRIEVGDQHIGQIDQRGRHPPLTRKNSGFFPTRRIRGRGRHGQNAFRIVGVSDRNRTSTHGDWVETTRPRTDL
ncbi:hypothetical protein GCM10010358_52220 [Streptomyces minutiscleroticus]|uniref:Uncharacterized protein n=1 Tax=Streptomyces minutiscleroticus TaxID=68238 RepID=A0A918NSC5_9ACTN|nr:hypothetical protein GCM10010358_52220 [Streptomyces minutiscleroticus]